MTPYEELCEAVENAQFLLVHDINQDDDADDEIAELSIDGSVIVSAGDGWLNISAEEFNRRYECVGLIDE